MKKIVIIVILLLFVCGCVQKTGDGSEKSKRPTSSSGNAYDVGEVEFYLPVTFIRNTSNITGKYEFYTGNLGKGKSSELYVLVLVKTVDENFDLDKYVASKDGKYEKKKINDFNWYKYNTDNANYYTSSYNGNVYDISIHKYSDPENMYKDTIKMFEKTLFFEIIEAK